MTSERKKRFVSETFAGLQPTYNPLSELQSIYNPLSGFQSVPLMSLEDAVKSTELFIPDIMTHVNIAKEKCLKNAELNINESAAVYLYTMNSTFYTEMNNRLRNENRSTLEPWFAYLKLFIKALLKLPPCTATIWRGVHDVVVSESESESESKSKSKSNFELKAKYIWWSVNSCSCDVNNARGFASGKGTLFCIQSVYGRSISKYSAFKTEDEVILLPGAYLRVKGVSPGDDGISIVHLEQG